MQVGMDKATVLAVDDTPENLDVVKGILAPKYVVKAAINGKMALKIAQSQAVDLILLDVMMPDMDGYEVCRLLKSNPMTRHIPIMFLSAKGQVEDEQKGFELGAVDYIQKPVNGPILKARVATQIALYNQSRQLETLVQQRTEELSRTREEIIKSLARASEYKDNETGLHVVRMSLYSGLIAEKMGLPEREVENIVKAAQMHDVGKIGIPDAVILKNGKLTDEEWAIMKTHPELGAEIIGDDCSELMTLAREVCLTHHEKWDGTGYPKGLKGADIPLAGRITAIADVFDALTCDRPYKNAWSVEDTVDLIKRESGTHFDPLLVDIFLSVLPQVIEVKEKYHET